MSDDQSNDHQMSTSEEMFPVVNRGLFDAVVALNAANGVKAAELKRVLLDLIAELRDQVGWYPPDVFPDFTADDPASQSRTPDRIAGVAMRDAWTRAAQMADRAEARLREVTGDE